MLLANLYPSQTKEIQTLLDQSFAEYANMNLVKSNKLANEALALSIKDDDDEGIAKSNMYIAKVLITIGNHQDGIAHLNELEKTESFKNNPIFQAENCRLRGRAYSNLKMYDLALKEFHKQLQISENIKDSTKRNYSILFTHENLIQVFKTLNQHDSIWINIKEQESILKKFKEEEVFHYISTMYVQTADELIYQKKYSEAENYLNQSLKLLDKYKAKHQYGTFMSLGNLESSKKNINKAIEYYEKGLKNATEINSNESKIDFYKKLANIYSDNNISDVIAHQYFKKHQILEDSLNLINKNTQNLILQSAINKEALVYEKKQSKIIYIVILLLLIGAVISVLFYFKYNKYKALHQQKDIQNIQLENELKENNFDALIQLAKQNNPEFLVLFNQLYPDFQEKLKNFDPNIRSSELTFCALAYLNFSTKDIAEYTFVTVRAVQVRKNRLRKKYNISSDKDFNVWMRNLPSSDI